MFDYRDGSELEGLKLKADLIAVSERIHFAGELYGSAADELLLCSDICVILENVGLSAMHSMAAGLLVISHDRFDLQMP